MHKRWRDMIKKVVARTEQARGQEKVVDLRTRSHAGHGFAHFVDPEMGRSYRINLDQSDRNRTTTWRT